LFYIFTICCGQVESHIPLFRFVVDLSKSRKVVDLLWICCTTCCTTNPQQIEQVEFELIRNDNPQYLLLKGFIAFADFGIIGLPAKLITLPAGYGCTQTGGIGREGGLPDFPRLSAA
jgi:hypothetical protein